MLLGPDRPVVGDWLPHPLIADDPPHAGVGVIWSNGCSHHSSTVPIDWRIEDNYISGKNSNLACLYVQSCKRSA